MPTTTYATRTPWTTEAAITWKVTRETPRQGVEHIIETLRGRYDPYLNDMQFRLTVPRLPREYTRGTSVRVGVTSASQPYGNVRIVYQRHGVDTSTQENKTAQKYWVFFNFGPQQSFPERNFFIDGR